MYIRTEKGLLYSIYILKIQPCPKIRVKQFDKRNNPANYTGIFSGSLLRDRVPQDTRKTRRSVLRISPGLHVRRRAAKVKLPCFRLVVRCLPVSRAHTDPICHFWLSPDYCPSRARRRVKFTKIFTHEKIRARRGDHSED